MMAFISWYLIVTLFGWLAWPLAFRLLPGLPDRGYTISRALGLLLVGYVFWLLTSLGLLYNTTGGIMFSALIILGLALWAYLSLPDKEEGLLTWLKDHIRLVIASEVLFLIAFAAWAVVRAYNPEISGTENRWSWPSSMEYAAVRPSHRVIPGCRVMPSATIISAM